MRRGMSLIEMLLGLFIFTTAFLMIMGVFPTSVRSVKEGRTVLLATHIAQQKMEALASGYAGLTVPSTATSTQSLVSVVNGQTEVLTFNCSVIVSDGGTDLKNVRCQVSWTDDVFGTGFTRTVNMETLVGNL